MSIVNIGRKGGSAVAVSIINALLPMAKGEAYGLLLDSIPETRELRKPSVILFDEDSFIVM